MNLMVFTTTSRYYICTVQIKQHAHGYYFHFGLASLQHFTSQHRLHLARDDNQLGLHNSSRASPKAINNRASGARWKHALLEPIHTQPMTFRPASSAGTSNNLPLKLF